MKILLTKTLFISLFLSAGAPVAITAKPAKERTACLLNGMRDNIKYLGRTLLPMKIALWILQESVIRSLDRDVWCFLIVVCLRNLEILHEILILLEMPLLRNMSRKEAFILGLSWGTAREISMGKNLLERLGI